MHRDGDGLGTGALAKLRALAGRGPARSLFVLGTGRSGTHWLGHTLEAHPEVRATIEREPMFGWATRMALDPRLEPRLLPRLLRAYRWQLARSAPLHHLDKSHPNLWIAEHLATGLPGSRFLGIRRSPYATVASMLAHPGVLRWTRRWREFPHPNRFLGITERIAPYYADMPLAARCALRWRAHDVRLAELRERLGDRMLLVEYEQLAHRTAKTLAEIQAFLGLRRPLASPPVRRASLDRWRSELHHEQRSQIAEIVGFGPDDALPALDPTPTRCP